MRYTSIFAIFMAGFLAAACASTPSPKDGPQWQSLFDGETLDGWVVKAVGQPLGVDALNTFRAEDGVIRVDYRNYDAFENRFAHLFYQTPFTHYRVRLEYRFLGEHVPGAPGWAFMNSGILLHAQDPGTMAMDQDFPVSIEAQFLGATEDDPDRSSGNVCTPGTHVVLDGELTTTHCIFSVVAGGKPGEWVRFEADVSGHELMRFFIDGQPTLDLRGLQFDENDKTAAPLIGGSVNLAGGYLALQSEGHPVEFRNIELLDLSAD